MSSTAPSTNLWHPFDILGKEELAVAGNLRNAEVSGAWSGTYTERVTRWFKDKSDPDRQWPPTVDRKPGIRLTCRPEGDRLKVEVAQDVQQLISHLLTATMECSASGWRSPSKWTAKHTFAKTGRAKEFLPEVEETGKWESGTLTQTSQGRETAMTKSRPARSLASIYTLLASFPEAAEIDGLGKTTFLQEGFVPTVDAELVPCPQLLQKHPLARGLRGYALLNKGNFPADYWVNESGVVIYLCMGPHRAMVLESIQSIS
jgi:hypothetical protein